MGDYIYTRRDFLKTLAVGGIGLYSLSLFGCGEKEAPEESIKKNGLADKVAVAKGDKVGELVTKAVAALGGMAAVVKKGDVVVVKPNIAWITRPELAGCTNPEAVATIVKLCYDSGAKIVKVFDRPCRDARFTYKESGIQEAAEKAGAKVFFMDSRDYVETDIPKGKSLKRWPIYRDVLEADVLINVPIAKVHGTSGLTLAMKNLMGTVGGNRGTWHRDIHQKLADYSSRVKSDLVIMDAYRIMVRNGPAGGSPDYVELKKTIIAGKDIVAVDAYTAKALFNKTPDEIRHIKYAHEMGVGNMDYSDRLVMV